MQKLAASLAAKGLSPETGVSAADEDTYGISLGTLLQYGDAFGAISQVNTHAYKGGRQCCWIESKLKHKLCE